jgi:hypothetical protein
VVAGDVGVLEDRRELVLARRDLVVPGLDRDAEAVELALDLGHERDDALRDGAEVVVVELLALGGFAPNRVRSQAREVGAGKVEVRVDQEVLLLAPEGGVHPLDALVGTEEPEDAHRLRVERLDRSQQRGLLVEGLSGPGHERGRDAERREVLPAEDERGAGRVPRGVPAGLERGSQTAGGKARSVGLALDEVGAAEGEEHAGHRRGRPSRRASRRSTR